MLIQDPHGLNFPKEPLLKAPKLPYNHVGSGKVRELYDLGAELLIIATDRVSAFDVVFREGIPGKGIILTQMSLFWFDYLKDILPNHIVPNHPKRLAELLVDFPELQSRSMIVKKVNPLPIEAIIRAYLTGSAWAEYKDTGQLWGNKLPKEMREFDAFSEPIFTPTTKSKQGHDEPLTSDDAKKLLSDTTFDCVKGKSLELFQAASKRLAESNFILADAKLEFGIDEKQEICLIDEAFTPDASRFWLKKDFDAGNLAAGFDKQFIRNYLISLGWNKQPPPPALPEDIVINTQSRYLAVLKELTHQPSY